MGRTKVTLVKLIRRVKETKKCNRDMPAPVSCAYVSRCLLALIRSVSCIMYMILYFFYIDMKYMIQRINLTFFKVQYGLNE